MEDTAKTLGLGNTVTIEGVEYQLTPFTWKMHGLFSNWLKDLAWKEVEGDKDKLDTVTYKGRHDAVTALIVSGYFKPGGQGFLTALDSMDGKIFQAYLMIKEKNREVTLAMVDAWFQTNYAIDLSNRIAEMERNDREESKEVNPPAKSTPPASSPSAPS